MNSFNKGSAFWFVFFKGRNLIKWQNFFFNWKKKLVHFEFLDCQISEEKPSKKLQITKFYLKFEQVVKI
jgi:hypothetical protein